MFTEREKKLSFILICIQVVASLFLFLALERHGFGVVLTHNGRIVITIELIAIWCYLFHKFNLGIIFRNVPFSHLLRGYLVTVIAGNTFFMIEFSLAHPLVYSREIALRFLICFLAVDLGFLIIFKFLFYEFMLLLRKHGHNSRSIAILADKDSVNYIDAFLQRKDWGYNVRYIFTSDESLLLNYEQAKVVKDNNQLRKNLTLNGVEDFFYCLPVYNPLFDPSVILSDCREVGITSHFLYAYHEQLETRKPTKKERLLTNELFSHFVSYQTTSKFYYSNKIKEMLDIVFSSLAFVFLSPLLAGIAIFIKLEDGGPVFFKQERVGLNGRRFTCLKFRTMIINAEEKLEELKALNESDGPTFKIAHDPRITKVGCVLRKTSLDELPQFYNVIKGEMSIVGPRPPLMSEVIQYERTHIRRLSVKPGITCIWQVSGRNALSFTEWMKLDLEYIDNWSLWLDFKLILKTIVVIFKGTGM